MNIIPKLSRFLQNIDLSNTEQFEYIELFDWLEMVNVDVIAQILAKNFFPRVRNFFFDFLKIIF